MTFTTCGFSPSEEMPFFKSPARDGCVPAVSIVTAAARTTTPFTMADKESEVNAVSSSSATATPHSLVSEDHVWAALTADKGAAARLTAWKIVDFTKKGDNYASMVSSVHVEYALDGRNSEVVYVVKLNSCKPFEDSDSLNNVIFEKEANFYMNLVPELNSVLKDVGHREINFPKCFYASLEHAREVIFLEDLRPRGYKMLDRRRGLDEAHATLVVRELARLHAASLLLQNKTPDHDLKEKHPFLEKGWYYFISHFDIMLKIMQDSVKFAREILNKVGGYDRVTTWIDTILPKIVEICYEQMKCGEPKVVCHGDCWNNNLLFSMTGDVRRPNTKVFLGSYHSTLRSIMEDAGQEVPFTQAQLLLDFRDKNLMGMIFAMMAVPVVPCESEEPVDSSKENDDNVEEVFRKAREKSMKMIDTNPLMKPRLLSVFEEMIEAGVIP